MIELLYRFQIILVGAMPIVAVLLSRVKLNGWHWLVATELGLAGGLSFYWVYGRMDKRLIIFYGLFIMLYLALMTWRLGHVQFSRAVSITLLLGYVLTEYWEIPNFIAGYLGFFEKNYVSWTNQAYLLVVIYLLLQFTRIRLTSTNLLYFLIPLSYSSLVLINFPSPVHAGGSWYVSRILCFIFLGSVTLLEVER